MMTEPRYKGLIFDMDGTLTVPQIDFNRIRIELGVESGGDLAEIIESWPEPRRTQAWELIERYEEEVMASNILQPGVEVALKKFCDAGIMLGIITRNTYKSSNALLRRLEVQFNIVLTREFPHIKPAPEPVLHILDAWKIRPEECMMIGDYIHDIQAAKAAGAIACYFKNPGAKHWDEDADFTVSSYTELEELVFSEGESQ
jgi:HAD superfamily hydrolase (TIGR01549 family)